jgi:hypothetical protein
LWKLGLLICQAPQKCVQALMKNSQYSSTMLTKISIGVNLRKYRNTISRKFINNSELVIYRPTDNQASYRLTLFAIFFVNYPEVAYVENKKHFCLGKNDLVWFTEVGHTSLLNTQPPLQDISYSSGI